MRLSVFSSRLIPLFVFLVFTRGLYDVLLCYSCLGWAFSRDGILIPGGRSLLFRSLGLCVLNRGGGC